MMHGNKCMGSKTGWVLVLVGALNWGLVGLGGFLGSDWNVVNLLLGRVAWLENLVYLLVGVAGVMLFVGCKCKVCKSDAPKPMGGPGM